VKKDNISIEEQPLPTASSNSHFKKDIDKEWSKSEIERWEKFLKKLEDQDYVNSYCEYIAMLKETAVNKSIATEGLAKKEYEAWEEDEDKKICWLEVVKILKVCENDCSQEEIINSNPSVLKVLYIDRLIRNGFIKEEEKEIVSAIERKEVDKEGGAEIEKALIISEQEQKGCDISFSYGYNVCKPVLEEEQKEDKSPITQIDVSRMDLKSEKGNDGYVTNNIAINVVASEQNILENDQYRARIKEAYSRKKRK
jgi:hypothetical protein